MAARSYFGKSVKNLTVGEGAMLAGLLKGPNYFNPDRHPDRAKDRLAYVLGRMQEDGVITAEQKDAALAAPPKLVAYERPHRDFGFHFVDFLGREAKSAGVANLTAQPYTVHSTINANLQRAAEAALQEGLAHYEIANGRMQFKGPEANLGDAMQKLGAGKPARQPVPVWQQALAAVHCRSTTCIGRRPWCCERAANAATAPSTSASPMAVSCRSTPHAPDQARA